MTEEQGRALLKQVARLNHEIDNDLSGDRWVDTSDKEERVIRICSQVRKGLGVDFLNSNWNAWAEYW